VSKVKEPDYWVVAMILMLIVTVWFLAAYNSGVGGIGSPNDPSVAPVMNLLGFVLSIMACFFIGMVIIVLLAIKEQKKHIMVMEIMEKFDKRRDVFDRFVKANTIEEIQKIEEEIKELFEKEKWTYERTHWQSYNVQTRNT